MSWFRNGQTCELEDSYCAYVAKIKWCVCCTIRCMLHYNNTETLKMLYRACVCLIINCNIVFWSNSMAIKKVFHLKKRIKVGVHSRSSCR